MGTQSLPLLISIFPTFHTNILILTLLFNWNCLDKEYGLADGSSRNQGLRILQHPDVHQRQLSQKLRELLNREEKVGSHHLQISFQKSVAGRHCESEGQLAQHLELHLHNVLLAEGVVGDKYEVLQLRRVDLFVLSCNEESSYSN